MCGTNVETSQAGARPARVLAVTFAALHCVSTMMNDE